MLRLLLPLILWLLWVAWGEMSPAAEHQVAAVADALSQAETRAEAGTPSASAPAVTRAISRLPNR